MIKLSRLHINQRTNFCQRVIYELMNVSFSSYQVTIVWFIFGELKASNQRICQYGGLKLLSSISLGRIFWPINKLNETGPSLYWSP